VLARGRGELPDDEVHPDATPRGETPIVGVVDAVADFGADNTDSVRADDAIQRALNEVGRRTQGLPRIKRG